MSGNTWITTSSDPYSYEYLIRFTIKNQPAHLRVVPPSDPDTDADGLYSSPPTPLSRPVQVRMGFHWYST